MSTQRQQALEIVKAVHDAVSLADPDMGAPGGHLYAAMQTAGIDIDTFSACMWMMVHTGLLEKRGECYFANPLKVA